MRPPKRLSVTVLYHGPGLDRYNACMTPISISDLQRDPLAILRRVEEGETLLVMRDEQPVAEIKPAALKERQPRPYGLCAGEFSVPADFDEPLPESVLKDFEGA